MVATVLALSPWAATAQAVPRESAPCTYRTCALRMQGSDILAGVQGRKIASFGLLSAPELRPWIEVSDSARHYVERLEGNYVSGQVAGLSGSLLWLAGFVAAGAWEDSDKTWVGVGVSALGLGLSTWGRRRVSRARDAVQSAIWWYNESLAGMAPGRSIPAPVHQPQHRGRAGAVLGTAVGIAAGLLVSSRHASDETAQGIAETAAFGAAGGFIGWRIGLQVTR